MKEVSIYDVYSGKIVSKLTCLESEVEANIQTGQSWIDGHYNPNEYKVVSGTIEPIQVRDADIRAKVEEDRVKEARSRRDALLSASDWTQVADAPVDQAAWAAYRQVLRDLPQQPGFPHDVAWPTPPTSA